MTPAPHKLLEVTDGPDVSELDRTVLPDFSEQEAVMIRFNASSLFRLSMWRRRGGVDHLAELVRAVFEAVPRRGLGVEPSDSERDLLRRGLKIFSTLLALALTRPGAGKHHSALKLLLYSLYEGIAAMDERDRGFDEPLLRARPRTADMPRETDYERQIKSLASMASAELIRYGLPKQNAAREVAKVVNRSSALRPKSHKETSVVSKSILNWTVRYSAGDLPIMGFHHVVFAEAIKLRREGKSDAARQKVLSILREGLDEVTSSRGAMESRPQF